MILSCVLVFDKLVVDFPYGHGRLRCDACKRAGSYRLARLAVKFGAEILLG